MTIVCPNGSSAASGAPNFFTFDQSFVSANLPAAIAAWAAPYLLGLPTGPQSTVDFCSSPPVGDLPTAADYAKLAFPLIAWVSGTYSRFGEQLKEDAFNQFCVCNGGGTGGPTNPCTTFGPFTITSSNTVVGSGPFSATDRYWNINWGGLNGFPPTGQRHVRVRWAGVPSGPVSYQIYNSPSNAVIQSGSGLPTTGSLEGDVNPGQQIGIVMTSPSSIPHTGWIDFWNAPGDPSCSGGPTTPPAPPPLTPPTGFPPAPAPPTCGSTQDVCNQLQIMQNSMNGIGALLTSLRDELLPNSLAESTVHSGLAGTGAITVSGILGFKVTYTTVAPTYGAEQGNPPTRWGVGRISWSDAEGVINQVWVGETSRYLVPPTTRTIGYSLSPGVTATITELTRGA